MISYKTIAFVREVFDPHIEIEVPSNIKSLRRKFVDEFFGKYPNATHIRIPKGIKKISNNAFSFRQVVSIAGLQNITTIGPAAFMDCKRLTKLEGLNSLTTICNRAFMECRELNEVGRAK